MEPITRVGMRDKVVKMNTTEIPCMSYCPHCGSGPMDGATQVEITDSENDMAQKKPKNGDYSLCGYCGEIYVFSIPNPDSPVTLRLATDAEMEVLKADKEQWELIQVLSKDFKSKNQRFRA